MGSARIQAILAAPAWATRKRACRGGSRPLGPWGWGLGRLLAALLLSGLLLTGGAGEIAAAALQPAGASAATAAPAVPARLEPEPPAGSASPGTPAPTSHGLEATSGPPSQAGRSAATGPPSTPLTGSAERQAGGGGPLERRLQQWPHWRLPAPLGRPGRQAPRWPAWFGGEWLVESTRLPQNPDDAAEPGQSWRARFLPDGRGGAIADRAFNAFSLGRTLMGAELLSVQDDPANPQRQLARLRHDLLLETTLIGQRGETPGEDRFLNDELSLQVLHGPGEPRVSRVETLGRWRRLADGGIAGEQWQARYASPGEGLAAAALESERFRLRLVPVPPESDHAS